MRHRSVTAFAYHFDLHLGNLSHDGTSNDSNISFLKVRDVMIAIDFINTIEAAFLDHG